MAAVLGAGIQGCCAALALRKRGFRVQLFDKASALYSRASANQEGKVHLGFVYARDGSLKTARTLIDHALRFAPAVEALVGSTLDWEPHLSTRFTVGIHEESTLAPEALYAYYRALQEVYEDASADPRLHYLGRRPFRIWCEDDPDHRWPGKLTGAVRSEETAIEPSWLRRVIVDAVMQDPEITPRIRHRIDRVERSGRMFVVRGTHEGQAWRSCADIVVNCLWEDRHRVDASLGSPGSTAWVTRVKYGFMLESTPDLRDMPSLIVTHGPFGDIVNFRGESLVYVSWYPACMAYLGTDGRLPCAWDAACDGRHPHGLVDRALAATREALGVYVPALRGLKLHRVMAGTIMGRGETDISDVASGLHLRQGIGVDQSGDYYSIFTGKFTSGPANAIALQELVA